MNNTASKLAKAKRAVVVAPAGCGKTETIARAVKLNQNTLPQLILTHTNAGIRVLRDRLRKHNIPGRLYRINTIAGWARDYATSYPQTTGIESGSLAWSSIYRAAGELARLPAIRKVLASSYSGVYVDEYQDCTKEQHALVMSLADVLPCRVLGDPLQGIFDIDKHTRLVDWDKEVFPVFDRLPDLPVPHRWKDKNEKLGHRLLEVRHSLIECGQVNLENCSEVDWRECDSSDKEAALKIRQKTCFQSLSRDGPTVGVLQILGQRNYLARMLRGRYSCVERADYPELWSYAGKIDKVEGNERILLLLEFICMCVTGLKGELKVVLTPLKKGRLPAANKLHAPFHAIFEPMKEPSPQGLNAIAEELTAVCKNVYRKDLFYRMRKALQEWAVGNAESLSEAVAIVCERVRHSGVALPKRALASTFLVKGLEFDHAVILNADELTINDLYVAMTRASHSLTILSKTPVLKPKSHRRAK